MELIAVGPTTPAETWAGEPTLAPSTGELITTCVEPSEGVAGTGGGAGGFVGVVLPAELPPVLPELAPGVVVVPGAGLLLPVARFVLVKVPAEFL
ncbi:MAG: hypothetical protein DMG60_07680 [Acidobacteria bacterium]|nr:MAG: hypothetical protein DMG60_07680 [Acidobacteriota bacterium]